MQHQHGEVATVVAAPASVAALDNPAVIAVSNHSASTSWGLTAVTAVAVGDAAAAAASAAGVEASPSPAPPSPSAAAAAAGENGGNAVDGESSKQNSPA